MRMNIAEPGGVTGDGVDDNGWLGGCSCLEHAGVVVSTLSPSELHIKVDLGVDGGGGCCLESPHDGFLHKAGEVVDPSKEGQLHDRVPDTTVVELFHQIRAQITKHLASVGNQELTTLLGSLETNKGCSPRSTGSHKLIVHSCLEKKQFNCGADKRCVREESPLDLFAARKRQRRK